MTSDETKRYGANRVWEFMIENIFSKEDNPTRDNPAVCLLLVGYKAEEEAFREFLEELHRDENREVTIFSINPDKELSSPLRQHKTLPTHIRLRADLAFDLLLQIIRHKYVDKHAPEGWVPVDRHRVLSYCFRRDTDKVVSERRRFEVELILQAVKSPGFFNVEAVALTHRIEAYDEHASEVIKKMRSRDILKPGPGSNEYKDFPVPPENYWLNCDSEDLAKHILDLSGLQPNETVTEWTVENTSGSTPVWRANPKQVPRQELLEQCLDTIADASHIEVSHQVDPATNWLFDDPKRLQSVAELHETTIKLFGEFLNKANGQIELYGVWDTAEWLFHEDGWAWDEVGEKVLNLLSQDKLRMSVVLAKVPSEEIPTKREEARAKKAREVRERISSSVSSHRDNCSRDACKENSDERCELLELDWWQHNRVLTLLRCNDGQEPAGIYMRRRHAAPLVAPVHVKGKEDCDVLHNIFCVYQRRVKSRDKHLPHL